MARTPAPKKPPKEAPKQKAPSEIIAACAAQGVTVFSADKLITPQQVRRPTGIASLDVAIAGGWPAGALSNVYGPPSVGKTWLMWRTLAMQQQIYGDDFFCVYVSLGMSPDLAFARLHGLKVPYSDPKEKDFFRTTYFKIHGALPTDEEVEAAGEKVGHLHLLFADTKLKGKKGGKGVDENGWVDNDKPMERLLQTTVEISKAHVCQMLIVDDIGGMPTQHRLKELYSDKGTKTADYAKLLTEWPQRLIMTLQMTEDGFNYTSVVTVSQVRVHISSGPFTSYDRVSSKCMDHLIATGVKLNPGNNPTGVSEEAGPRPIDWKIWKGKFGHGDGARGKYTFTPTVGIDYGEDLFNVCRLYKVIVPGKVKGSLVFQDDVHGTETVAKGEGSFLDKIDADPVLYAALYAALMRARCPGMRYR